MASDDNEPEATRPPPAEPHAIETFDVDGSVRGLREGLSKGEVTMQDLEGAFRTIVCKEDNPNMHELVRRAMEKSGSIKHQTPEQRIESWRSDPVIVQGEIDVAKILGIPTSCDGIPMSALSTPAPKKLAAQVATKPDKSQG